MKLKEKDIPRLKLALWAGVLVWMVFFIAFSVVVAKILTLWASNTYSGTFGQVMVVVIPIWVVFTALLTVYYIAKFVGRKLKVKGE